MALGTDTAKSGRLSFPKKIACQFTVEQFQQINAFADSEGITFAAAVRRLIFVMGPLKT